MRKWLWGALIVALIAIWGAYGLVDSASADTQRTYLGASKCRTCHKKDEVGAQYPKWEAGPHAGAYKTLAGEEAKKIAAEKGLGNPQEAAECLKCHVTGYGVAADFLGPKYDMAEGVGCESCHGPGGDYYKKATMVSIIKGEVEAASVGLVKPTEETCTGCHNEESPTFDGFNFDEMFKKIAHPIPEAHKATYKSSGS